MSPKHFNDLFAIQLFTPFEIREEQVSIYAPAA